MISVAFDHVCSCLVAAYRWSRYGARCGVMVAGGNCPNFAWKFRVVGHDRAINRSRIYSRSPGLGGELFVHEVFFQGAITCCRAALHLRCGSHVRFTPKSEHTTWPPMAFTVAPRQAEFQMR
jgi:hypothetical protein